MRIDHELSRKEYRRCFNLAQGIFAERKKLKRNPLKRIRTYSQILISNYLLCLIDLPFIAYFDTFVELGFFADIFVVILLITFFLNTFSLFMSLLSYIKAKKNRKGELRLEEIGITDTIDNGRSITRNWKEIELIYIREEAIFLIAKNRIVFIIPKNIGKEKEILDYLLERQKENTNIKIIDTIHEYYPKEKFLKKHFLNWGIYILIFIILMVADIAWDDYNLKLIDKEMHKIEDSDYEVDNTIYSFEKFGIVEKELKDFFHTFRTNYNIYLENSATGITYLLTTEFLEKNRDSLDEVLEEFPDMEKKAEKAINKIMELADEEKMLNNLEKMEIGEPYLDVFKAYAFSFANTRFKREWSAEIYNNSLRMQYLTRMVEILAHPNACWYIEEENLYFCDDEQLKEYNELYDLLMKDNKQFSSSGVKM